MNIQPAIDRVKEKIQIVRSLDQRLAELESRRAENLSLIRELERKVGSTAGLAKPPRAGRGRSSKWQHILSALRSSNLGTFTYRDAVTVAASIGYKVSRQTAHSQLKDYASNGLVKKLTDGSYKFPDHQE